MENLRAKFLQFVAEGLFAASHSLFNMAIITEGYAKKYLPKADPTMEQWVNRLIEFIDAKYIVVAYNYFCGLVYEGYKPDEAFAMTVGKR